MSLMRDRHAKIEDGRIDVVTLRTPLAGITEAWKAMNAANLAAHRRIRRAGQAAEGGSR